ncbi:MAG: site-2 protease family protein [Candidatus Brocadiia bacterium]
MPFFGKDRTLFKIFGIPVKANLSWLFLVGLVMFTLAEGYFPQKLGDPSVALRWGLALIGAMGLFACLLVHELCHSLVARRTGMPVGGITLFIFGGVSQLQDEPPTAPAEFFMALVGPAASIVLGIGFLVLWFVGRVAGWGDAVLALTQYLWLINFVLAAFNLMPAFPLDGGRIVRSVLWGITDDLRAATNVAANIGSFFGLGLIVLGVILTLQVDVLGGLWMIVIGFFLRQAAMSSLQMVVIRQQLEGETVRRFMTTDLVTVPRDISVQEFVDEYVFHHRFSYYPVVEKGGRLLGMVSARAPRELDNQEWPKRNVQDLMEDLDDCTTIHPDMDAVDALSLLREQDTNRAVVVEGSRAVGMLSLRDLLQFLAVKIDLEPRGSVG